MVVGECVFTHELARGGALDNGLVRAASGRADGLALGPVVGGVPRAGRGGRALLEGDWLLAVAHALECLPCVPNTRS